MSNGTDIPKSLNLKIISPTELVLDTTVKEVFIPGVDGERGILPGHRSLVLALGRGKISFDGAESNKTIFTDGGYAEIHPDSVLLFIHDFVEEQKDETQ